MGLEPLAVMVVVERCRRRRGVQAGVRVQIKKGFLVSGGDNEGGSGGGLVDVVEIFWWRRWWWWWTSF